MAGSAGGGDDQNSDGRTPAARLAALEAAVEALGAVVRPDGTVHARHLVVGPPTAEVRVTVSSTGSYTTVELWLDSAPGADTKIVLFAGRGANGGDPDSDGNPRLGAAIFGGGTCRAGIEVTQDSEGSWSVGSLGETP
ncbi:MAG TPA: hypothetical protein VHW47_00400 [Acidimicrobiales bacterium]|nr:hypothetical protein [Acidimicrobiales bacterium]